MTPTGLFATTLAAALGLPLSLFAAAAGQGIGALLAGGGWIGLSVGWDRQAWALVNQPVLNFASLPSATGYWLGSSIAPLLVAALAIPLSLRLRSLTAQLIVVQWAWMAAVIGVSWQPALTFERCQTVRWLEFRGLPPELGWAGVALAAVAAVPIVLRLIAIARITRFHLSRARRVTLVGLHLLPAPLAWAAATTTIRGSIEVKACIAAGVPILVVLAVAWIGYPAPLTHPVEPVRARALALLSLTLVLAWAAFWISGRPLAEGRVAAVQWGGETSTNNIYPWMEPLRAPWLE
jgi:hypothetical protein